MKTLSAVAVLAATVFLSGVANAQTVPGDLPQGRRVDDGTKSWMWVKPTDPPSRDRAKENLDRSANNRFAYNPDKPITAVTLVAGPLLAIGFAAGVVALAPSL